MGLTKFPVELIYKYPELRHVKKNARYSSNGGAVSKRCHSDHWHQSGLEANYCDVLLALKNDGKIADFKKQHKLDLRVGGLHIAYHYVDFLVTNLDGSQEHHEVKGAETDVWTMKMRLSKVLFPDIPYITIK